MAPQRLDGQRMDFALRMAPGGLGVELAGAVLSENAFGYDRAG